MTPRDERRRPLLGNPLRSEGEAFRWLLAVAAVAALVIAAALLVRAVG